MPAGGPLFGAAASGADSLAQPAGSGFPLAAATPSLSARALPRSSSTEDALLAATGFPQFSAFAQQSSYFQPALFATPVPPAGLQRQQPQHHQPQQNQHQQHQMAQAAAATPLHQASQLSHGACAPGWWQPGPSYLPYSERE